MKTTWLLSILLFPFFSINVFADIVCPQTITCSGYQCTGFDTSIWHADSIQVAFPDHALQFVNATNEEGATCTYLYRDTTVNPPNGWETAIRAHLNPDTNVKNWQCESGSDGVDCLCQNLFASACPFLGDNKK